MWSGRLRFAFLSAAAVVASAAAGAVVLSTGSAHEAAVPYSGHHTFVSSALHRCIDSSVHGVIAGTRTGTGPLTRWSNVRLQDSAVTATASPLTAGQCDSTHPALLEATLAQTWTIGGRNVTGPRSAEGPVAGTLRQFNSGDPIRLPDSSFPATLSEPDYTIHGGIVIEAHVSGSSEAFRYPVTVRLDASGR